MGSAGKQRTELYEISAKFSIGLNDSGQKKIRQGGRPGRTEEGSGQVKSPAGELDPLPGRAAFQLLACHDFIPSGHRHGLWVSVAGFGLDRQRGAIRLTKEYRPDDGERKVSSGLYRPPGVMLNLS